MNTVAPNMTGPKLSSHFPPVDIETFKAEMGLAGAPIRFLHESESLKITINDLSAKQRRRLRLWIKADKKCHWCKRSTRYVLGSQGGDRLPDEATVDHIVPRGRNGNDTDENVVSACHVCNMRRNQEDKEGLPEGALMGEYCAFGSRDEFKKMLNSRDQAIAQLSRLENEIKRAKGALVVRERFAKSLFNEAARLRVELSNVTIRSLLKQRFKEYSSTFITILGLLD